MDGIFRGFKTKAVRVQLVRARTAEWAEPDSRPVHKERLGAGSRRLCSHGHMNHVAACVPEVAKGRDRGRRRRRHRFRGRKQSGAVASSAEESEDSDERDSRASSDPAAATGAKESEGDAEGRDGKVVPRGGSQRRGAPAPAASWKTAARPENPVGAHRGHEPWAGVVGSQNELHQPPGAAGAARQNVITTVKRN